MTENVFECHEPLCGSSKDVVFRPKLHNLSFLGQTLKEMALQKVGAKALAVVEDDKKKFVPPKPPKKVLDEDAYTEVSCMDQTEFHWRLTCVL